MLPIHIEPVEIYNDVTQEFSYIGPKEPIDLNLEHSLYSIAKWESKYHKFYSGSEKTPEEVLDYFSMMVVGKEVSKDIFLALKEEDAVRIKEYIDDPMTATIISEDESKKIKGRNRNISAELVYYWMTALNIPFECQYWHFNRLITLIRVCSIESDPDKNKKKKKFSTADMAARRAKMEAARAKYKH